LLIISINNKAVTIRQSVVSYDSSRKMIATKGLF